ncbi:MAG: CPBP family intramembrane glutamic endopeptidase [bacterium]
MTRKPIFWIVCSILFIGSVIFTLRYFSKAYPIVSLDLQMDRQAAVNTAQELAEKHQWGPEEFRQAAIFQVDNEVKNYVELEIGGAEAFRKMIKQELYFPYTWRIRHFKENETNETLIRFTPKGSPYGFREKLPEDEAGPSLSIDSALIIAEQAAVKKWDVNLAGFELVEKSKEVRPSDRTDHTFVYERPDVQLGEARYRLRLVVSGDKLTELTHFVKIPEAFSRQYQEMRSANNTIATSALIAAAIIYIIGGCLVGLFFLLKQGWVMWRKPLFWGLFVAFMTILAQINQWPLAWMNYDTALSSQWFLLQQIVLLLLTFLGEALLLTITFMAAESLTRKAFPHHIQFWQIWSSKVASSKQVLGRTIGGYLAVGFFLAFDVALYLFATNVLGWWTPSAPLFDPNILATYFPWLSSIAISLHAGFWEECLFRAVPIAGAVLLGKKFGKTTLWVIAAFIVQPLIFGAAHATYAQQPAYARVVELIIPSIAFGLLYFYFGLLPAIIMHYAVDVVWIGMPLFVSSAPGIWIDRILVIIFTFVPLFIIFWHRIRTKKWKEVEKENYNESWKPPKKAKPEAAEAGIEEKTVLSLNKCRILLFAGIAGLVVWFFTTSFNNYAPYLDIDRSGAEKIARETLAEKDIELSDAWQLLSRVQEPLSDDDRFIWQNEGEEKYQELLGEYLSPPRWQCRYVRFEGEVAERAEEYQVFIGKQGKTLRFRHILPEARAGVSLNKEEARLIALSVINNKYKLDASRLKEVSAEPSKLPERKDWLFTFADEKNHPLNQGEARIAVKIAGDKVVDSYQYIHVPEEWERQQRNRDNQTQIVQILMGILIFLIFVTGIISSVINWSRKKFSVSVFLTFFFLLFVLGIISIFNEWPLMMSQFSTAEPLSNQIFMSIAISIVGILFISAGPALVNGFIISWKAKQPQSPNLLADTGAGFGLGMLIVGLLAVVSALFEPSLKPLWADYSALNYYVPILNDGLSPVPDYILSTTLFLLIITTADRLTKNWKKRKIIFAVLIILTGFLASGISTESLPFFLLIGLIKGIVYLLAYVSVFRYNLSLIPLATGSLAIVKILQQGVMNAYPTAIPGAVLAIILIGVVSVYWYQLLKQVD